jgi:hypothetical protein
LPGLQGVHGAQQRGLLVKRLAGVAAERRGDAQHLVLDERVAGGVPGRVAAGLEGGAQAAVREAGSVGLALDELLAGELRDGGAVAFGLKKLSCFSDVMPVRGWNQCVKCVAPFSIAHSFMACATTLATVDVDGLALLDRLGKRLVHVGWETLLHRMVVEYHRTIDVCDSGHAILLRNFPASRVAGTPIDSANAAMRLHVARHWGNPPI